MPFDCASATVETSQAAIIAQADTAHVPRFLALGIAQAESSFDTCAVGDDGCSIGLFQLNTCGGQGTGYDPEYLKNPWINSNIALGYIQPAMVQAGLSDPPTWGQLNCIAGLSGHPNALPAAQVYRDAVIAACQQWFAAIGWAGTVPGAFAGTNPGNCAGLDGGGGNPPPPPPPTDVWCEPFNPVDNAGALIVIMAHLDRMNYLMSVFPTVQPA